MTSSFDNVSKCLGPVTLVPPSRGWGQLSTALHSTFMFSTAPHVDVTYTSLNKRELGKVWHWLKHPLLPSTHNIRTHSTLFLSKGYPSAPEPNSSHVFWKRSTRLYCASPEKALAFPHRPRKMLQMIEGADNEGFLLTPDRYWWVVTKMWIERLDLRDTWGIRRVSEVCVFWMNEPCCVMFWHHALLNIHQETMSITMRNQTEMTNREYSLCTAL